MTVRRVPFPTLGIVAIMFAGAGVVFLGAPSAAQAATRTTTTTTTTTAPVSTTDPGSLVGQGGAFLEPVINALLNDDTSALAPLNPEYTNANLDNAIASFVGTGPGSFNADFALSERPLTSAEVAAAATDGRDFAYVPIAATPVSIVTLVPNAAWIAGSTITSANFCQGMPLTTTLLGDIFGNDTADPLLHWNDSRITCGASGGSADGLPISLWANGDPTLENETLMNLLDSTPTSKQLLDAGLADSTLSPAPGVTDTPSENWPYTQNKVPDGDEALIGKLLNVNPETNQPDTEAANWSLGAIAPISAVWTGAPLGVAWDLPSAAIQNAQGSFVPPTEAAAAAAEADATLASTSDPTTNNLVTFNASTTDASAYNNYLMVEDYLVVPTNGLPADKATKLAQFVRYALGTAGQQVISSFGVAPATPAMVTAGLKVAADLDTEALGGSSTSTSTTTTTTAASTTSTTTASSTGISTGTSTGASSSAGSQSDGSGGSSSSSGGSGPTLAFTGGNPLPLLGIGLVMVVAAVPFRRAFRRRRLPT